VLTGREPHPAAVTGEEIELGAGEPGPFEYVTYLVVGT
jgi:hypothetical protein